MQSKLWSGDAVFMMILGLVQWINTDTHRFSAYGVHFGITLSCGTFVLPLPILFQKYHSFTKFSKHKCRRILLSIPAFNSKTSIYLVCFVVCYIHVVLSVVG